MHNTESGSDVYVGGLLVTILFPWQPPKNPFLFETHGDYEEQQCFGSECAQFNNQVAFNNLTSNAANANNDLILLAPPPSSGPLLSKLTQRGSFRSKLLTPA